MAVLETAGKAISDIYNNVIDEIGKFLSSNKEFISGMGVGAALATPQGRALVKRLGVDASKILDYAKSVTKQEMKDLYKKAVTDKLAKVNLSESAFTDGTWTNKIAKATARAGAVVAAGKILGNNLGYTITEDNKTLKALRIAFPAVFATTDIFKGMKDKNLESKAKKASDRQAVAEVLAAVQQEGRNIKKRELDNDYDNFAAQTGMSPRPSHPLAMTEWQKEVERQMRNKGKLKNPGTGMGAGKNAPAWYFQGLANKLLGTNLTWTGVKSPTDGLTFAGVCGINVVLTHALEEGKLHPQILANANIEYQALRGKNTGAFNYDVKDVYLYDFHISACIALGRFIAKLISLSNYNEVDFIHLPVHLYAAYDGGFTGAISHAKAMYDDVVRNKPNHITRLNSISKALNGYAYRGRTLNSRWNYVADKCIKDFNGPKAVLGIYVLESAFFLDPSTTDAFHYVQLSGKTITELLDIYEAEVNRIASFNSGKLLKVAGDMIKLLGATNDTFANVPYYTGTEVPRFEYDPEAVDQLRNAKICQIGSWVNTLDAATMSLGVQPVRPKSIIKTKNTTAKWLLDDLGMGKDSWLVTSDRNKEFDAKENIQMVQFSYTIKPDSGQYDVPSHDIEFWDIPFAMINDIRLVQADNVETPTAEIFTGIISIYTGNTNDQVQILGSDTLKGTSAGYYVDWIPLLLQIDFMPRMQVVWVDSTRAHFGNYWLDIDDYAFMTNKQFRQFNNVAVYSQTFVFTPDEVNITGLIASN